MLLLRVAQAHNRTKIHNSSKVPEAAMEAVEDVSNSKKEARTRLKKKVGKKTRMSLKGGVEAAESVAAEDAVEAAVNSSNKRQLLEFMTTTFGHPTLSAKATKT